MAAARTVVLFGALLHCCAACPQSLFAEANFAESQYSAMVRNLAFKETSFNEDTALWRGFAPYAAEIEVVESFYGDIAVGETLEVILYISYLGKEHALETVGKPYIVSFCKAGNGMYYTNRDFLIVPATQDNIREFRRLAAEGTDFDGNHDCTSTNYPELNPDKVD